MDLRFNTEFNRENENSHIVSSGCTDLMAGCILNLVWSKIEDLQKILITCRATLTTKN